MLWIFDIEIIIDGLILKIVSFCTTLSCSFESKYVTLYHSRCSSTYFMSLYVILCHYVTFYLNLCHSMSFYAIPSHSMSFYAIQCHSMSLNATYYVCHSLSHGLRNTKAKSQIIYDPNSNPTPK